MLVEAPAVLEKEHSVDLNTQELIDEVTQSWGWGLPPSFVQRDAHLAVSLRDKCLADALVEHELLTEEQVQQWLGEADPSIAPIEILQARSPRIRNSYEKLMALSQGIQFIPNLSDESLEAHPYLLNVDLNGKPLKDRDLSADLRKTLESYEAALVLIQQKTTCIVFSDIDNGLSRFTSLDGPEKKKNPITRAFGDTLVFAVSSFEQVQKRMQIEVDVKGDEGASQSIRSVYKHKLQDDPDRKKLSVLHELAIAKNASDIHIDPDPLTNRIYVTHRVWGEMERSGTTLDQTEYGFIKQYLLQASGASIKFEMIRTPLDGMYRYNGDKKSVFVRASFIPFGTMDTSNPLSICLRHIPSEAGRVHLADKQVHEKTIEALRNALTPDAGMVLVVGPTGSGKSTTVSGAIGLHQELHGERKTRFSIEDPVERYLGAGIVQFQVPYHLRGQSLGFTGILRNLLRHDPQLIWVGEIRDADTAEISVQAAATGHLLISTLHADGAVDAVDRLSNLIPPSNQSLRKALVKNLSLIVSQRLIRRLCKCSQWGEPDPSDVAYLTYINKQRKLTLQVPERVKHVNKRGCEHCQGGPVPGFVGIIPVNDVLPVDKDVRAILMDKTGSAVYDALESSLTLRTEHAIMEAVVRGDALLSALKY